MKSPNYKLAIKRNYRFSSSKGMLTTEELYGLSLEELDKMAQVLDKKLKEGSGSSFIPGSVKRGGTADQNKLAIIVDVIQTIVEDQTKAKNRAKNSAEISRLRQILAEKMDDETRNKSTADIMDMLSRLQENNDEDE